MQSPKINRVVILNLTLFSEAGLLLVATCWCYVAQMSLAPAMQFSARAAAMGVAAGAATASFGFFLLLLARKFRWLTFLVQLQEIVDNDVAPLFAQLKVPDILLVSMSSGLCEEVFFRGVLQQQVTLIPASILFGLIHCPSFSMIPYAFWTFIAGLFLGWLYDYTHCLWAPILAHFVSNLIVLLVFRFGTPKQSA
jgi:membrane protease YdiL (CAAX protease family)